MYHDLYCNCKKLNTCRSIKKALDYPYILICKFWNFLVRKCICVFLNVLRPLGCTYMYNEIMGPEQNLCVLVFYAGHTSK